MKIIRLLKVLMHFYLDLAYLGGFLHCIIWPHQGVSLQDSGFHLSFLPPRTSHHFGVGCGVGNLHVAIVVADVKNLQLIPPC